MKSEKFDLETQSFENPPASTTAVGASKHVVRPPDWRPKDR